MDVDEITAVLSRASEIRSKINGCIERATSLRKSCGDSSPHFLGEEADEEVEGEGLLNIRDALECLEEQLCSLQVLQQQQRYEREATLTEIDRSRKILLKRLKEYKGDDLDVIREATVFVGETVDHDDDLLLPPYLSRLPSSSISDKNYSLFSTPKKSSGNGIVVDSRPKSKDNTAVSEQQAQASVQNSRPACFKFFFGVTAKTVLTIVGVVSALSLAGFEPKLQKRSTQSKVLKLFHKPATEEAGGMQCPPGKVLVVDDGEPRCLVKERVEFPFEPVVATPDISYGYG